MVLKRYEHSVHTEYSDSWITVDFNDRQVLIEGNPVKLISLEFKLLFYLVPYVVNSWTTLNTTSEVYVSLMTIIVVAILMLSVIVVTFVLYLLVRTMLNNKKRDYGIMKALGFTTAQLVLQTAISFMTTVIFSMIVGLIVSFFIINPLLAIFLGVIGIVKCIFSIPIVFITVVGTGMILLSFAIVRLLSLKIKKNSPKELLIGE